MQEVEEFESKFYEVLTKCVASKAQAAGHRVFQDLPSRSHSRWSVAVSRCVFLTWPLLTAHMPKYCMKHQALHSHVISLNYIAFIT